MGRLWPNPDNPREPKWLEDDIEAVLEWQREQNLLCPGCGHPRDESMASEEEDPDLGLRYRVEWVTCRFCLKLELARKEDEKLPGREGRYPIIVRR